MLPVRLTLSTPSSSPNLFSPLSTTRNPLNPVAALTSADVLILLGSGVLAGVLAGFLGIGGGTILVPILVALGKDPIQAVATSSLSIVMTSLGGSVQNWRMGLLKVDRVVLLGFPALVTAQGGVALAQFLPDRHLLLAFGGLLLLNVYLVEFRKRVVAEGRGGAETTDSPEAPDPQPNSPWHPTAARLVAGGTAGLLAGLFGIGGGVILVPLQILLLGDSLKQAIQTSLGVIVLTAIAATAGHGGLWPWLGNLLGLYHGGGGEPWTINSNVLWLPGLLLGCGGLAGVQVSTRLLPKLDDRTVSVLFRSMLFLLALYIIGQGLQR